MHKLIFFFVIISMDNKCIVWFRKDLRLHDNPALDAAKDMKKCILYLYLMMKYMKTSILGSASIWWLENSLNSLNLDMKNSLKIVKGDSLRIIQKYVKI